MLIAVSHWFDSKSLASAAPLILALTGTPLGHPAVALCRRDLVALDVQHLVECALCLTQGTQ